ncbi:hypothetical protein [uncultured Massilia sp.]|uniref:hypothetical protein n=1 Tax=uncultured Massilia sp. TaxID=169973 RepID=UPI0025DD0A21|nr:hypothetical protein [uncultured Massilia sp.]
MKIRLPKHQSGMPGAVALLAQCCGALDRSIPGLRTALLVAGIVAAALRTGRTADFLFVSGLLFHMAIWLEGWWMGQRPS